MSQITNTSLIYDPYRPGKRKFRFFHIREDKGLAFSYAQAEDQVSQFPLSTLSLPPRDSMVLCTRSARKMKAKKSARRDWEKAKYQ